MTKQMFKSHSKTHPSSDQVSLGPEPSAARTNFSGSPNFKPTVDRLAAIDFPNFALEQKLVFGLCCERFELRNIMTISI